MKKLLREPLVHFLILGAAVFALFRATATPSDAPEGRIVVTPGKIEQLATAYVRTWQRAPTEEELQGLIEDHVRDEVLAREAFAMGLDKDDTVIRRRLRQKLEFLTEDAAGTTPPSDRDLQAWLTQHPDKFRVDPKTALRQVFVNASKRGAAAKDAEVMLARLNAAGKNVDTSQLGDPTMLPDALAASSADEIARVFGDHFAKAVAELEPGRWSGPVKSSYGLHLVYVSERTPGRLRPLAEVREEVQREWLSARRKEVADASYRAMRERYTVVVERPAVERSGAGPATAGTTSVARGQ